MTVDRIWDGQRVVIFATGPSLCSEDTAYVKDKAKTIAVNDAYKLAPWADVLYASDIPWWAQHQPLLGAFRGVKYSIARSRTARPVKGLGDVQMLRNTGTLGLETNPTAIRTGLNSGYAAINLAVHFGAKTILLLGFNMAPVNGQRHFFGNHKGLNNSSDYNRFARNFHTLVEPLRQLGVTVINCTAPTRLQAFPCRPLREVLA